ncbi:MAG: hypothetical protein Q9Q13_09655 [Acidobacteriota bacterium]|nr:hypothetical protein [Acidobacteriota bacterium]
MLFCGPEGVGKRSAALGLAAGLVCRRGGIDRACGRCPPCQRVLQSRGVTALRRRSTAQDRAQVYPDIGFVGIPEGKTRISVLQARDVWNFRCRCSRSNSRGGSTSSSPPTR